MDDGDEHWGQYEHQGMSINRVDPIVMQRQPDHLASIMGNVANAVQGQAGQNMADQGAPANPGPGTPQTPEPPGLRSDTPEEDTPLAALHYSTWKKDIAALSQKEHGPA